MESLLFRNSRHPLPFTCTTPAFISEKLTQMPREVSALAIASRRKPIGTSLGKQEDNAEKGDDTSEAVLENFKPSFQEYAIGSVITSKIKVMKVLVKKMEAMEDGVKNTDECGIVRRPEFAVCFYVTYTIRKIVDFPVSTS